MRNKECSCGSGKKYKKCCLPRINSKKAENIRVKNRFWEDQLKQIKSLKAKFEGSYETEEIDKIRSRLKEALDAQE